MVFCIENFQNRSICRYLEDECYVNKKDCTVKLMETFKYTRRTVPADGNGVRLVY